MTAARTGYRTIVTELNEHGHRAIHTYTPDDRQIAGIIEQPPCDRFPGGHWDLGSNILGHGVLLPLDCYDEERARTWLSFISDLYVRAVQS